jgi:hypothetical protein
MIARTFRGFAAALAVASAVAVTPRVSSSQGSTDDALSQAISFYENLDVERALVLLRRVISPSSPFEVSRDQRVRAYTYLAATLAIVGQRDSAIVYFRAALERDPFIDLDPGRFTPQEVAALADARRQTFITAVRPLAPIEWDPLRDTITFRAITTHQAMLRMEIHPASGGAPVVLYEREGTGLRDIPWNGLLGGQLVAAGVHELCVIGKSELTGRIDSTVTTFRIVHRHETLEDTLPELSPGELLPERRPPNAGRTALVKGLAVAGAALIVPALAGNADLGRGGNGLAVTAAAAAAGAGVAAFIMHRRSPELRASITRNAALRAQRAAANAEIARRNADRLARTRLTLVPGGAP